MKYSPYTVAETNFLRAHYLTKGAVWCAAELDRTVAGIYKKVQNLELQTPFAAKAFSTLYSSAQLTALQVIGNAYRAPGEGVINFDTATELRDLVRANRIDEALGRLEQLRLAEAA